MPMQIVERTIFTKARCCHTIQRGSKLYSSMAYWLHGARDFGWDFHSPFESSNVSIAKEPQPKQHLARRLSSRTLYMLKGLATIQVQHTIGTSSQTCVWQTSYKSFGPISPQKIQGIARLW